MSEWLPISSAPKNLFHDILLYTEHGIIEGYWSEAYGEWRQSITVDSSRIESKPTHWMPLPESPYE